MADNNKKYGLLVSDDHYIYSVVLRDMQEAIANKKESGFYSENDMKEIILDKLDELEIYESDIEYIIDELKF